MYKKLLADFSLGCVTNKFHEGSGSMKDWGGFMLYKLFEEVISWAYKNGFLLIFWHCLYFTATNLYPLMEYYIEWWWYGQFQLWSALFRMYGYFIYVLVWFHIFLHLNILEIFGSQSIYGSIEIRKIVLDNLSYTNLTWICP